MSQNKKIVAVILLLIAAYFASIAIGVYRLKSSALYPMSEKALVARLTSIKSGQAASPFYMKWYSPWQYSANASTGFSQYQLCATSGLCYRVIAVKADGMWNITWFDSIQ